MVKKKEPTELITYLCTRCEWDFSRTDQDLATCTLCGKGDRLQEMRREPITPEAVETAMMQSMDKLMSGLKGAYDARAKNGETNDTDEIALLEMMAKTQNLQKTIEKSFAPRQRKPVIHAISIKI